MKIKKGSRNKQVYKMFKKNQAKNLGGGQIKKNKKNFLHNKNNFFKCYRIRKQTFFDLSSKFIYLNKKIKYKNKENFTYKL